MTHLTIDCILIQWKTVKSPCTQGTSSSVRPWPSSTCGFLHQQCPYLSFPICAIRNLTETFPWNFSTLTDVWGASLAHSRSAWTSERWAFPQPWLQCPSRCSPQKICCSLSSLHRVTLQDAGTVPCPELRSQNVNCSWRERPAQVSPGTQPSCLSLLPHPPQTPKHTPSLSSMAWSQAKSTFWNTEKAEATGNTDLGVTSRCKAGSAIHSLWGTSKLLILTQQCGCHDRLISNFLPVTPGFIAREFENRDSP